MFCSYQRYKCYVHWFGLSEQSIRGKKVDVSIAGPPSKHSIAVMKRKLTTTRLSTARLQYNAKHCRCHHRL
jgi:hypothetical protein